MLDLRKVTLVVVATRAHELTELAIKDCLRHADFGDVLIFTNDAAHAARVNIPGARYYVVPDWSNKRAAGKFYYSEAALKVETEFGLFLEWDAGIYDPTKWRDDFFEYDYIGAPWVTRPGDELKVGNGGFTLMSTAFSRFLCENRDRFPVYTDWDVCRSRRPEIEDYTKGQFKWAPYDVAADFAWELAPRSPNTFGYHGIFNWPDMLGKEETVRRAILMTKDEYLLQKIHPLIRKHRWVSNAVGDEAWQRITTGSVNPDGPNPPPPNRATVFGGAQREALLRAQNSYIQVSKGLKA